MRVKADSKLMGLRSTIYELYYIDRLQVRAARRSLKEHNVRSTSAALQVPFYWAIDLVILRCTVLDEAPR